MTNVNTNELTEKEVSELRGEFSILFHHACYNRKSDVVLLEMSTLPHVDIKYKDGHDNTCLHDLLYTNSGVSASLVSKLIARGADPKAVNDDGVSVFHSACRCSGPEVLQVLLDAGADMLTVSDNGSSALHFTNHNHNTEAARFLVSKGIDIFKKNRGGNMAHEINTGQVTIFLESEILKAKSEQESRIKAGESALALLESSRAEFEKKECDYIKQVADLQTELAECKETREAYENTVETHEDRITELEESLHREEYTVRETNKTWEDKYNALEARFIKSLMKITTLERSLDEQESRMTCEKSSTDLKTRITFLEQQVKERDVYNTEAFIRGNKLKIENDKLKSTIDRMTTENAKLKSQIQPAEDKGDGLSVDFREVNVKLNVRIHDLKQDIESCNSTVTGLKKENDKLKSERDCYKAEYESLQKSYKELRAECNEGKKKYESLDTLCNERTEKYCILEVEHQNLKQRFEGIRASAVKALQMAKSSVKVEPVE